MYDVYEVKVNLFYLAIQKMFINRRQEGIIPQGSTFRDLGLDACKPWDVPLPARNLPMAPVPHPARIRQQYLAPEVSVDNLSPLLRNFILKQCMCKIILWFSFPMPDQQSPSTPKRKLFDETDNTDNTEYVQNEASTDKDFGELSGILTLLSISFSLFHFMYCVVTYPSPYLFSIRLPFSPLLSIFF